MGSGLEHGVGKWAFGIKYTLFDRTVAGGGTKSASSIFIFIFISSSDTSHPSVHHHHPNFSFPVRHHLRSRPIGSPAASERAFVLERLQIDTGDGETPRSQRSTTGGEDVLSSLLFILNVYISLYLNTPLPLLLSHSLHPYTHETHPTIELTHIPSTHHLSYIINPIHPSLPLPPKTIHPTSTYTFSTQYPISISYENAEF